MCETLSDSGLSDSGLGGKYAGPGGYGPERKSIVDSLMRGCIPIITSPELVQTNPRAVWRHNWHWQSNASVYIDYRKILNNKIDILTEISSIPVAKVRFMQQTIEKNIHTLHWGTANVGGPDALHYMLKTIMEYSKGKTT